MLKDEIKRQIKGDVEDAKITLDKYSHDYSIFEVRPELVVFPKDADDIKRLIKFLDRKRDEGYVYVSVTPRGAGTDMAGGPLNESIILDTTRYMRGVKSIKKENMGKQRSHDGISFDISGTATVLPGTFYRDFEVETLKEGLIMPCFPASRDLCAVGGMVANNGAGEKSLKYGQNKDFVKSLKVVLDDGEEYDVRPITKAELEAKILENNRLAEIYRKTWNLIKRNYDEVKSAKPKTTKNSSGYLLWDVWDQNTEIFDGTKLFIGAQGTTGIITEITYKLVSVEEKSKLLVVFVKDLDLIPELTHRLLKEDVETLEVYDDHTLKFAIKFFGSFLKQKGIVGSLKYAWQFMPEFFQVLFGGMPKLIVLAEFVSNDEEGLEREARLAESRLRDLPVKTKVTKNQAERNKYFDVRHDSFKLLSDHSKSLRTAPFIDDVVVPVDKLPEYWPELTRILDENKILYTVAGHLGDGNLHVVPLMNFNDPKTADMIMKISEQIYPLVKKFGGSMTAEHNDGLIRTPYIPMMFGEKIAGVFREFKEIADPHNMWNPKKKVGATLEDIKKYIIRPKK